MKGNEISVKELRADAVEWLTKLHQTMLIKEYGKGSVRNYCQEMRMLLNTTTIKQFRTSGRADIEQYLQYIKDVHKVGRTKCRSVAQACSFFL
ncbi:MAG: phage integrase N-terminal SAM-like domain-containing protein [Bacteroidota bacterium]|nr:phage integrase N-terminal SAM-like domain-containing protein [Bacteroidota bacterium]